jgi:hypothetical protein
LFPFGVWAFILEDQYLRSNKKSFAIQETKFTENWKSSWPIGSNVYASLSKVDLAFTLLPHVGNIMIVVYTLQPIVPLVVAQPIFVELNHQSFIGQNFTGRVLKHLFNICPIHRTGLPE